MRFNKQELYSLASHTSKKVDREGILVVKEKQECFFRRKEGCTTRWFRLSGNILFYLRGPEPLSEPMGFIILGQHKLSIQPRDEKGHWPIHLLVDNTLILKLATFYESDQSNWTISLNTASHTLTKQIMNNLETKLLQIKPIINLSEWRAQKSIIFDIFEMPMYEIGLSCDNLLCDSFGRPPSPMVHIIVVHPDGTNVLYNTTEMLQKCSNPIFSKTTLLRSLDKLTSDTKVQFIVYDVKEVVSQTLVPVGSTCVSLKTIQESEKLRLALSLHDKKPAGFISISAWSFEPSPIGTSPHRVNKQLAIPQKIACHRRSHSLPSRLGLKFKFPSFSSIMKHHIVNSQHVSYRFHSGLGGDIAVHEIMAEFYSCFDLPIQLLTKNIEKEKEFIQDLLAIGDIKDKWKTRQYELLKCHTSLLKHYTHSKQCLESKSRGNYFKRSSEKDKDGLDFAPVNLHLQRMWVHNDTINKSGFHDIVTVGAFTAHTLTSDNTGGLIKLVQQLKYVQNKSASSNSLWNSKYLFEQGDITTVHRLKQEIELDLKAIITNVQKTPNIDSSITLVKNKIDGLKTIWDARLLIEAQKCLSAIKNGGEEDSPLDDYQETDNNDRIEKGDSIDNKNDESEYEFISNNFDENMMIDGCYTQRSFNESSTDVKCDKLFFCNDYFKLERQFLNEIRSSLRFGRKKYNSNHVPAHNNNDDIFATDLLEYIDPLNLDNDNLYNRQEMQDGTKTLENEFKLESFGISDMDIAANTLWRSIETSSQEKAINTELVSKLEKEVDHLISAIDSMIKCLRQCAAIARIRHEEPMWTRSNAALQLRRDTCFAQAVTATTCGLVCWLTSAPSEVIVKLIKSGIGPLCSFEGLLSLYANERPMWGDMVVAVEDLLTVIFQLTKKSKTRCIPKILGSKGALTVEIPISDDIYSKFESSEVSFTITPVFFNIGIDERASIAEALDETGPQSFSNKDNFIRLDNYCKKYKAEFTENLNTWQSREASRSKSLKEVMESLQASVQKKVPKNREVLELFASATMLMNGIRFTSCKSAKDRTGMSTTLEQCRILLSDYHLAENDRTKVLRIMRSEGCRRLNTLKNIGVNKYAFTKKTVAALPEEYRPPAGTYGSKQT